MQKNIFIFITLLLLGMLAIGCAGNKPASLPVAQKDKTSIELNVSAALGLKEALLDIKKDYEQSNPAVKIVFNLAAAGVLEAQIEQGAPADIFISAANKQINDLAKKNLIDEATRKNIVSNKLVLIVPKESTLNIKSFQDLASSNVIHYGLGETDTVPAGQYGKEVLEHLGVWEQVKNKAVLAKDVRTILSYVETGNADAGIVFSTVAVTSDKIKIAAAAPNNSHEPIIFPGVVLANCKHPEAAKDFLNYLGTPSAMAIFKKYGFQTID